MIPDIHPKRTMKLKLPLLVVIVIAVMAPTVGLLVPQNLTAQTIDSLHIRYRFKQGDTLSYRLYAFDSITVFDVVSKRLLRERTEIISFRCDSVLPNGYIMTTTMREYGANETLDTLPTVRRTVHDWVGRSVTYQMSSTGFRVDMLRYKEDPGTVPGGPFEPLILPAFSGNPDSMFVVGSSIFPKDMWLFDNAYPPVKWNGTSLRRFMGTKDTLNRRSIDIQMNDVAQISYYPGGDNDAPMTQSKVNGSGNYLLNPELGCPISGTYDLIADITFTNPKTGEKVTGRHVMSVMFELLGNTNAKVPTPQKPKPKSRRSP